MVNDAEWLKIGIEVFGLALGAATIIYSLKGDVKGLSKRMDQFDRDFKEHAAKLDNLSQLFVQFARFDERFVNLTSQHTLLQKKVDELSHGEGFVVPFKPPAG
jgi:hypothetical protein